MRRATPIRWITPVDGMDFTAPAAWLWVMRETGKAVLQSADEKHKTEFIEAVVEKLTKALDQIEGEPLV